MKSLEEVWINNVRLALNGFTFVNPVFRELTAQFPAHVNKYTFYGQDPKKIEKRLKRLMDKEKSPFVFIIRDEKADLDDVIFIPYEKDEEEKEKLLTNIIREKTL